MNEQWEWVRLHHQILLCDCSSLIHKKKTTAFQNSQIYRSERWRYSLWSPFVSFCIRSTCCAYCIIEWDSTAPWTLPRSCPWSLAFWCWASTPSSHGESHPGEQFSEKLLNRSCALLPDLGPWQWWGRTRQQAPSVNFQWVVQQTIGRAFQSCR